MTSKRFIKVTLTTPIIGLSWLAFSITLAGAEPTAPEALAFWKKEAKPLLEQSCWKCHGAKERIKGDLRLTTREGVLHGGEIGPAVDLEKPESSLLLKMISYKDEDHEMPPIGKLEKEKIAILEKWIQLGLPFDPEDEIHGKEGGH